MPNAARNSTFRLVEESNSPFFLSTARQAEHSLAEASGQTKRLPPTKKRQKTHQPARTKESFLLFSAFLSFFLTVLAAPFVAPLFFSSSETRVAAFCRNEQGGGEKSQRLLIYEASDFRILPDKENAGWFMRWVLLLRWDPLPFLSLLLETWFSWDENYTSLVSVSTGGGTTYERKRMDRWQLGTELLLEVRF